MPSSPTAGNNQQRHTEGWHHRLNQKAGCGSLTFYMLMLLQEAKLVTIHLQLVSQDSVTRNRRPIYLNMDAKIFDLWKQYDHHDIVYEDFLA